MSDTYLGFDEVGAAQFVFPGDWEAHSAIWLSWQAEDHKRGRPVSVPQLQLLGGLHKHQKVALIVQDEAEQQQVTAAAGKAGVPLDHVTFYHAAHVGLWARDMGPQFSRSLITGKLAIVDWGFNQSAHSYTLRALLQRTTERSSCTVLTFHLSCCVSRAGGATRIPTSTTAL